MKKSLNVLSNEHGLSLLAKLSAMSDSDITGLDKILDDSRGQILCFLAKC